MEIQTIVSFLRREIPTLEVPNKSVYPPINFKNMLMLQEGKPFEGFDVELIVPNTSLEDVYQTLYGSVFFSNKIKRERNFIRIESLPATSKTGGFWFNSWFISTCRFRTAYVGFKSNIKMNDL